MNCPWSDEELEKWDGVTNPMGIECAECEEWDCEHNINCNNPEHLNYLQEDYNEATSN